MSKRTDTGQRIITLEQLIAEAKLSGALTQSNGNLTSANFPESQVRGELRLVELETGSWFGIQEALDALDRLGYRPATVYEGAHYASTPFENGGWDGKTTVGILGSVWRHHVRKYDCASYLWCTDTRRELSLREVSIAWSRDHRFLAVLK